MHGDKERRSKERKEDERKKDERNKSSKDRTWSAVPDALLGVIC